MADNNWDMMEVNELSKGANGGTEQMMKRLYDGYVSRDVLDQFQIIPTRTRELKEDKFRILWVHDLPGDPEVDSILGNEGWRKFHRIVFVTHIQSQAFITRYQIPWSKTMVMHNAITAIPSVEKPKDKINIIYHTTPHRGLNVLLSVYDNIVRKHQNVHLDVYSSFKLYGWEKRDEDYKGLFEFCEQHPNITYHGAVSNEEVRGALQKAHVFAYPSIWEETSCLALIEAMSAGCLCVHPDYGSLPETASNWTNMYHWTENVEDHARMFVSMLDITVAEAKTDVSNKLSSQKTYIDVFYDWETRKRQWEAFLKGIIAKNEPKAFATKEFVYRA